MKPNISGLVVGLLSLVVATVASSQTEQPATEPEAVPVGQAIPAATFDAESGLRVEERRYDDRLDGVTVLHDAGVEDYYDLSDPDIQRREGGIIEGGGAMRTWRLGGGKK